MRRMILKKIRVTGLCLVLFSTQSFYAMLVQKKSHANKTSKPVVGDIFILPNAVKRTPKDTLVEVWATSRDNKGEITPNCMTTAKEGAPSENHCLSCEKWKKTPKGPMLQSVNCKQNWRTHANIALARSLGKSDNWNSHGHPVLLKAFPLALPFSLLKNQREDSFFELKINAVRVQLRCKQNGYRHGEHKSFLNFEQMLAKLLADQPQPLRPLEELFIKKVHHENVLAVLSRAHTPAQVIKHKHRAIAQEHPERKE